VYKWQILLKTSPHLSSVLILLDAIYEQ